MTRTAIADTSEIPIIRPTLPELDNVQALLAPAYQSGQVTCGSLVRQFEEELASYCRVSHAVAMSSCTAGLMLAFKALGGREGAEVILPSFTFAATAQALIWNKLTPVFVDCLPGTMTIDPGEVRKAITSKTAAICPVTVYGLPPDFEELRALAQETGIPLISDSAQGMGATYQGTPLGGFGRCEVFSFSPTKVVTAIEGGAVTTNDRELAEKLRSLRDYGKGPNGEEMAACGLSARMSELHAAVGLLSLRNADALVAARHRLITMYREQTVDLPGCTVQEFPRDRTSSGNYFTLFVEESAPTDRDSLHHALKRAGIQNKRYFYPPVHTHQAFQPVPRRVVGELPNTWTASRTALALPLYSHMDDGTLNRIIGELRTLVTG